MWPHYENKNFGKFVKDIGQQKNNSNIPSSFFSGGRGGDDKIPSLLKECANIKIET